MSHAHQWVRGACLRCRTARCETRNDPGFRCVLADEHPAPHRYADGTTDERSTP